ncbi:MAG: GNAT family N-acetyltransferase [Candidatus Binataceae bacterium]
MEQSNLTILPLDRARAQWRSLLSGNPRAQIYHGERWIEGLRRSYGFEFQAALLDKEVRAGCVFARARRPFRRDFIALPFSDACPPLAGDRESENDLLAELSRLRRVDSFQIRGVTGARPWRNLTCFLSWEIDISQSIEQLQRLMASNFRRNIVKARKSAILVECGGTPAHLSRFYALHSQARRRNGLPCQPFRFFRHIHEIFGTDAELWFARRNGEDLASDFLLREQDRLYYKWGARGPNDNYGASHLLLWSVIERHAGQARSFDLGRTDERNTGLNRFKHELGGLSTPLPYAYFPQAPENVSAEVLSGKRLMMARIWRRMPPVFCRTIERFLYGYLS